MNLMRIITENLTVDLEQIQNRDLAKDLQSNLKRIGYKVTVDGVIGRETLTAYAKFKKDRWLGEPDLLGATSAQLLLEAPDVQAGYFLPTNGVGVVTSQFGPRGNGYHKGIDIGAPKGTGIHAIADGVIETICAGCQEGNWKCGGGYGNVVYIRHSDGKIDQTRYAHLDRVAPGLREGETVAKGRLLGYMGNTGHSFGVHLHFEIRVRGIAQNPLHHINPIV